MTLDLLVNYFKESGEKVKEYMLKQPNEVHIYTGKKRMYQCGSDCGVDCGCGSEHGTDCPDW